MGSLKLENLNKAFGAVRVLHDIDLQIENGNSSFSSVLPAAENPRCCASSPALRM